MKILFAIIMATLVIAARAKPSVKTGVKPSVKPGAKPGARPSDIQNSLVFTHAPPDLGANDINKVMPVVPPLPIAITGEQIAEAIKKAAETVAGFWLTAIKKLLVAGGGPPGQRCSPLGLFGPVITRNNAFRLCGMESITCATDTSCNSNECIATCCFPPVGYDGLLDKRYKSTCEAAEYGCHVLVTQNPTTGTITFTLLDKDGKPEGVLTNGQVGPLALGSDSDLCKYLHIGLPVSPPSTPAGQVAPINFAAFCLNLPVLNKDVLGA